MPAIFDNLLVDDLVLRIGWVIGFVDGEGCFSISFVRQPSRLERSGYRSGYQVFPEFVVTQGAKSIESLLELRRLFDAGQVLVNRRIDNHREPLYRYVVRRRADLIGKIVPFFERFPLRTAKQDDFTRFAACMKLMARDEHLTPVGFKEIAVIAQSMNRRKARPWATVDFVKQAVPISPEIPVRPIQHLPRDDQQMHD